MKSAPELDMDRELLCAVVEKEDLYANSGLLDQSGCGWWRVLSRVGRWSTSPFTP